MAEYKDGQKINEKTVKAFRSKVLVACPNLVTLKEQRVISTLPLKIFEDIFKKVFNADMDLATEILFNEYKDSDKGMLPILLSEAANANKSILEPLSYDFSEQLGDGEEDLNTIYTIKKGADFMTEALKKNNPIFVISDVDMDGYIAQSIALEVRKLTGHPMSISGREYNNKEMGFNLSQIEQFVSSSNLSDDDEFLVICADMGSNQKYNQEQFLKNFPNAKLIIADHHTLQADNRVEEDLDRSVLVSPFVKGSARLSLKRGGGVSGSFLLNTIASMSLRSLKSDVAFATSGHNPNLDGFMSLSDEEFSYKLKPKRDMARAANLLEYVDTNIKMKPLSEFEIQRAYDISSVVNKGRSLGKWIGEGQHADIEAIRGIVGDESTDVLQSLRRKMIEQNHIARAIFESLGPIFTKHREGDLLAKDVPEVIASNIVGLPADKSSDRNYLEMLRPYIVNFNFENQFPEDIKNAWLGVATTCLNAVGKIERDIIDEIRAHKLIVEVPRGGKDFVSITRPENPLVSRVFTEKQRSLAYSNVSKEVDMTVTYMSSDKVILKATSEHSMLEILDATNIKDPEVASLLDSIKYSGHSNIGYIELPVLNNVAPVEYIERLADIVDIKVKAILDNRPLENIVEVAPIHLKMMKEIFQKMRLNLEPSIALNLVMRVDESSHFEDAYSTEMRSIKDIVEDDPWKSTSEALDFNQSVRLSIPNQAIKAVMNSGFKDVLGVKFLPNGNYMANKVVTAEQLKNSNGVTKLMTPLDREREELKRFYVNNYVKPGKHLIDIPRAEAMSALKFMRSGEDVFKKNEALVLGLMDRLGVDSHVVLDVEADGPDAVCIMVGLSIMTRAEGVGETLTRGELESRISKNDGSVSNYRKLDDDSYIANEQLNVKLASYALGKDGSKPIRVSLKVQNLTNITQAFIDEVGMSTLDAQEDMSRLFSSLGKFVIQAHNLPYDRGIMKVNFPKAYEYMRRAINLDSAVPSKELELAYVSTTVSVINARNFYNAAHKGYNLSSLLEDVDGYPQFKFPGLKGDAIIEVSGQTVNMVDTKTGISSLVNMNREQLAAYARSNISTVSSPKYSIEKMLRVLTIKEMVAFKPSGTAEKIGFNAYNGEPLPEKLWTHFQDNYAFDLTLEQNLNNFQSISAAMGYMNETFHVENIDGVDKEFSYYREYGAGKTYDLGKKPSKGKVELFTTITGRDIVKANALRFLESNPELAERFSLTWVYESILDNHEITSDPKDMPAGFFDGMSKMTGFPVNLLKKVYTDAYDYKKDRGIKTYKVEETHNVVNLEGDAYQETHAFYYPLQDKLRNPFAVGEYALDVDINPNHRAIDALAQEAASSTIKQTIQDISGLVLDGGSVNNYSSKKLENFSDDGISIKGEHTGVPSFTCKGIKGVDISSGVKVEVPGFDVDWYRSLPKSERVSLDQKLNKAVSAIVFANSLGDNSLSSLGKGMMIDALTSPEIINALKDVNATFGEMKVTRREYFLKGMCGSIADAIIGKGALSLPGNPEVPPKDLDGMVDLFEKCIDKLKTEQGFDSFVNIDDIKEQVELKKAEYLAYEASLEAGVVVKEVPGYEPTSNFRAPGAALKAINNSLQDYLDACPELTKGILTVKKDPLGVFLKTPMVSSMVKFEDDQNRKLVQDTPADKKRRAI